MLPMAVARSFSGGVVMSRIPVSWTAPYVPIMGLIAT